MKYYNNILKYLIPVWMLIFSSICQSQGFTIDLNLLNTGIFNEKSFSSVVGYWDVKVDNNTVDDIEYILEFELIYEGEIQIDGDWVFYGYTWPFSISSGGSKTHKNTDSELQDDKLHEFDQDEDFRSHIEDHLGYLPPGTYTLVVTAYDASSSKYFTHEIPDPDNFLYDDKEIIIFSIGDQFEIVTPNDNEIFESAEGWGFAWSSPGFRAGVEIEYKLIIAAIVPEETESPSEAIDYGSNNSVYYYESSWDGLSQHDWPTAEMGGSFPLNVWYHDLIMESDFDPFVCGYNYAWRMQAREYIKDYPEIGMNKGLWGWPDPEESVIRQFTWGAPPSNLESPLGEDVLPEFSWDQVWCAEGDYDIQITLLDDSNFEETEMFDVVQTPFQYPESSEFNNVPGLIPGEIYNWRARAYSVAGETPWSNTNSFEIQAIELIEPEVGQRLETVRPYFNFVAPKHIAHYVLIISDEEDEDVVIGNVFRNEIATWPWQYPSQNIEIGLFPAMKYFWKLSLIDDGIDEEFMQVNDEDYKIMGNFAILPIHSPEPATGATNVALTQRFTWDGPRSVPIYEFWLSDDQDPTVDNPQVKIEITGTKSLDYPKEGDFPLEYEKMYYWKVVPKDVNNFYGLPISHSNVYQFTAADFPEMGEEVTTSNSDLRIPIINIETKLEGLEYTIFIYEDSEGSSSIEEIPGIKSFPYEYTDGIEILQWGTTYYIQVQPTKNGENIGSPTNIMNFVIPEEPEVTEQCEISCELTDNKEIQISIITKLEDATEYLIIISQNEDMSNPIEEKIISSSESEYLLSSENVDWGQTYYFQANALLDGEMLGLPSDIQIINVESKPGMNEQTAISVSLPEGSNNPIVEIINEISGATGYRLIVSTESDMSVELIQFDIINLTAEYPSDGPQLQFGKSYYITAQGLDGDNVHGQISSIIGIFIPNITPPVLGDPFNWEVSIPAADHYLLEVSLVEDFSALVFDKSVQGTSYPMNMDELAYSKNYYWRVQALSSEDEPFGNLSLVKFFKTEDIPAPTLNSISEEVDLNPELTWSGIDMALGYQIIVSSDGSMENILWQESTGNNSAIYPESAILLEFASTYYWQVIALGEDDIPLSQSPIESFSTKSVYPVSGLKPDGGAESSTPTLQWDANEKISSYMINIGSDAEMSTIIVNQQVEGNSLQITEGVFSSGVNYYWIVDGLDENGKSLAGPSKTSLLVLPSTNEILLISPIGGAQVSNLNPLLKWGGLEGISSYTLRVALDTELGSLILETVISGTEATIPEENRLNNSTSYYWQIDVTTENAIIISTVGSFITPSSATLDIQSPGDGETVSVKNPMFSWEAPEGVPSVSIRFAVNPDFSESWDFQIGAHSFEYPSEPTLEVNTTYYWQVSPLNKEGNPIGGWTAPRSFIISAAFIVELELPGNGEVATSSKPTFQWGIIENVPRYEIQVSNNEDFSTILWSSAEIVENITAYPSAGAEKLSYGQTYFWRVRAMGEGSPLGDFSSTFSFDISGAAKVDLEGPLEESENLFPYFSWLPVNGASVYTVTLSSDESMATIIYNNETAEVFHQYPQQAPPLNNGITYYWNVFAKDGEGSPLGDISNIGSFNTPSGNIEIEFMFGNE